MTIGPRISLALCLLGASCAHRAAPVSATTAPPSALDALLSAAPPEPQWDRLPRALARELDEPLAGLTARQRLDRGWDLLKRASPVLTNLEPQSGFANSRALLGVLRASELTASAPEATAAEKHEALALREQLFCGEWWLLPKGARLASDDRSIDSRDEVAALSVLGTVRRTLHTALVAALVREKAEARFVVPALRCLGDERFRAGNYVEARAFWEEGLRRQRTADALADVVVARWAAGDASGAAAALAELRKEPAVQSSMRLGNRAWNARFDLATLTELLAVDGANDFQAGLRRAELLERYGMTEDAGRRFLALRTSHPNEAAGALAAARTYARQATQPMVRGDADEARRVLRPALQELEAAERLGGPSEAIAAARIGVVAILKLPPSKELWGRFVEAMQPELDAYAKFRPGRAEALRLALRYTHSAFGGTDLDPTALARLHGEMLVAAREAAAKWPDDAELWNAMGQFAVSAASGADALSAAAAPAPAAATEEARLQRAEILVSIASRLASKEALAEANKALEGLEERTGARIEGLRGDAAALEAILLGAPAAWTRAQAHYVGALTNITGESARWANNLAVVRAALGQPENALTLWDSAIKLSPKAWQPQLNRAMHPSAVAGKVDPTAGPAETLGARVEVTVWRAQVLAAQGKSAEAAEPAQWALRYSPREINGWYDGPWASTEARSFTFGIELAPVEGHRMNFSQDARVWLVHRVPVTRAQLEALASPPPPPAGPKKKGH